MPLSENIAHYEDLRTILDEALASDKGVAIQYTTRGKAVYNRHRIYQFRKLDRMASLDIYPVGDSARGTSIYDALEVEYIPFENGEHWLRITHAEPLKVVRL